MTTGLGKNWVGASGLCACADCSLGLWTALSRAQPADARRRAAIARQDRMRTWAAAVRWCGGAYAPVAWANGALRAACEASERATVSLEAACAARDCLHARQAAAIREAEVLQVIARPTGEEAAAPTQLGLCATRSLSSANRLRRAATPKAHARAAIAASMPIDRKRRACRSSVLSLPAPSAAGTKQLSTAMSSISLKAAGRGRGVLRVCCAR